MESNFKPSEFVVSEDTAKWVRLINSLHEVWNNTNTLVDDDEAFMENFYSHFADIEKQCAEWMAQSILNNMGWNERPENMI